MHFQGRELQPMIARLILPALLGLGLGTTALLPVASGQTKGTPGGATGTTVTPATNTTKTGTTSPATPSSSLPSGFQATPQFVNGKVVMDDGTPPPDGIPIQRVCSSVAHTEGHTDSKGNFGFEMGHEDIVQDASYSGQGTLFPNRPEVSSDPGADPNRPYRDCEIRANLPGYRSDSILLATYRPDENTNMGTIILHRMADVKGSVISANTAAAPKPAAREYEKGLDSVKKGKTDDAVQSFGKAVELYPGFAAAWFELGKLQLSLQQNTDAQRSFEAATKAEPKFISPYLRLSDLAFKMKNWQTVADVTDRVLELDAVDFPQQYYYNGLAKYTLHQSIPAEKSLRDTIKLDTQNRYPQAHKFLAALLVLKQDLPGAAEELRAYLRLMPNASDADTSRTQLAELDKRVPTANQGK